MPEKSNEKKIYHTIDDIAKELGVSKTTVSRAISGKGRMSAKTREKILNFIEECNYRPNAVAQSLARNCTFNLGLVLPEDYMEADMPFFQKYMKGVCEEAADHNYDILVTVAGNDSITALERIIDYHKVDGIITSRSTENSAVISCLKEKNIPFVVAGYHPDPEVVYCDHDTKEACCNLITLLIAKGMKKMALFGRSESHYVDKSRLSGFEKACRQTGVSFEDQLVFWNLSDNEKISKALDVVEKSDVDVIVCMDDYICNITFLQMREKNIAVPQDIKIVSLYDSIILQNSMPSITSLRFDAIKLGKTACKMLLSMLSGEKVESSVFPEYQMILRDSTK